MTSSVNSYPFINTHLQAPPARSSLRLQSRSVEAERIKDSSCYDTIIAKYPGMDSASKVIVKMLCDDQVNTFDPGNVPFSNDGIKGIGDALEQNSNLKTLRINNPACLEHNVDCIVTLGTVLGTALKVNRGLQNLAIDFGYDSSLSSLATLGFLSNLNCFNLRSLNIVRGNLDAIGGEASFPKVLGQKFPLLNFTYTNSPNMLDSDIITSISNGIGNNSCLKYLDFSLLWQSLDDITTLFTGIGGSKIESFGLPIPFINYSFSEPQKRTILQAVEANPCFLNYIPSYLSSTPPFPSDFAAAIKNITKNRTPCLPDPACDIAQTCSTPTPSPSPAPAIPTSAIQFGLVIGIGGTIATVALTALGIFAVRKCREGSQEERQHLIQ